MDDETYGSEEELISRAPSTEDLVALCRYLNASGTKYIVVGGFAIRGAGYGRETMDLDLIIATDLENEAKVYKALESLPDKAVLELEPGEVSKYTVVRVGDEICVDLMASASGIAYEEACQDQIIREIDGVPIPFASPRLLYRMKKNTHREKDRADLLFLRENYAEEIAR
jgi:hypothetical protein